MIKLTVQNRVRIVVASGSDGAQMLADDFHLVELDPQRADLLFQVIAAQPPALRIRVHLAAAIDAVVTQQLAVELVAAGERRRRRRRRRRRSRRRRHDHAT